MMPTSQTSQAEFQLANGLIQKIRSLPPERVAEVDDFVEFLQMRVKQNQERAQDLALIRMISQTSESSFASVWDNAEDEAYDAI